VVATSQEQELERVRVEHSLLLALKNSQAFFYFLDLLEAKRAIAEREVTADVSPNREFHAGRLSALNEAMSTVDKRYESLRELVEVVS